MMFYSVAYRFLCYIHYLLLTYLYLRTVDLMSVILDCLFSYLLPKETRIYKEVSFSISFGNVGKTFFSFNIHTVVCVREGRTEMHEVKKMVPHMMAYKFGGNLIHAL